MRADTTVVEADIEYPTDSGLSTVAVCRIGSRLRRLRRAGVKMAYVDRTTTARALQHSIGVWLRRRNDDVRAEVLTITGQLAEFAAAAVTDAENVVFDQARRRRVQRCWPSWPYWSNALDDPGVPLILHSGTVLALHSWRVGAA